MYIGGKLVQDPCNVDSFDPETKLTPEKRARLVEHLSNFYKTEKCPKWARIEEDFEKESLNPRKIRYLFNAIDRLWHRGRLFPEFRTVHGLEIEFDYHPFPDAKLQPCAKTTQYTHHESGVLVLAVFHFNANRFGDSAKCRETNGIRVKTKLEALIQTSLHELAHLVLRVRCKKPQGHNRTFRKYNAHVNGAHPKKTGYEDDPHCVLNSRPPRVESSASKADPGK